VSTAITQQEVRGLLHGVAEPCSLLMGARTDIVTMGLLEQVVVDGAHVGIEIVVTDTSCVHFGGMERHITDVLTAHPAVETVTVTMSTTTLWTPDRQRTVVK
jgi:metal-sulfur cluster biosynthetic enzyme